MKEHLKNLIERLSNYSEKLNKIALFADKKWVFIDDEGNQQSYIFARDGDLVMSKNGKVKMGKWKFYPEAQSIKIDRLEDQILLNQAFFDRAVMILKYDGYNNNNLFVLADQNLIPDLNVESYLDELIKQKFFIKKVRLNNGKTLEIYCKNNYDPDIGNEVTIDGQFIEKGAFLSQKSKKQLKYYVNENKIIASRVLKKFICKNRQTIIVELKDEFRITNGDKVLNEDGSIAPDGKYKLGFLKSIKVNHGKVIKEPFL